MQTLKKTKAAMQGRQCHYQIIIHEENTRVKAGGQRLGQRNFVPADFIQDFGSSLAFLRWRRLISPFTAVTMNCAFVSPSSRLLSKSATTSCGKRALSCCDLLLVEPVAITESPCARCDSVYAKKIIVKGLKCDSLACSFKNKGAIHLVSAKPGSASTLTGPLTKPLVEVTVMAELQHTQTRPEFTWRFLSASERYPTAKPLVIYVNASSEQEARDTMTGVNLIFAARLPFHDFRVVEVCHA
ncbi:host cell division inhibitor Icd-like protein [Enterobacter asburiae]|nr:host cell division inhibitor Icd-like protein [Enterobacter asburiae]